MPCLLHYFFALAIWKFGGGFAFLDSDDLTTLSSTSSISDDSLWNDDLFSSCPPDGIEQPSRVRARNPQCPPDPQIQVPEIPGLSQIQNALSNTPLKDAPDRKSIKIIYLNSMAMSTNDPNYYCARYAQEIHSIPVCGSGNEWDRVVTTSPYYSKIENSKLCESMHLDILFRCGHQKTQIRSFSRAPKQRMEVPRIRIFLLFGMGSLPSGCSFPSSENEVDDVIRSLQSSDKDLSA